MCVVPDLNNVDVAEANQITVRDFDYDSLELLSY